MTLPRVISAALRRRSKGEICNTGGYHELRNER